MRFASVICGLPVVVVVSLDYDIPDKAGPTTKPDNLLPESFRHNFIDNHSHATISFKIFKMSHLVQKVGRCQGMFVGILVLRDCSGGFVSPRSLHRGAQACHFHQTRVRR